MVFQSGGALVDEDTNNASDVFVHDRQNGITTRVSVDSSGNQADSDSFGPLAINGDGSVVVFESVATNLVSDDTNEQNDVFVHSDEQPADPDPDADGVPDMIEDSAPNGGDGNDDGTPDSEQSNVTSLPNEVDDQYVTVASPPGTTLVNVVAIEPSTLPPPPDGLSGMPLGVISFEVVDLPPNGTAVVEIFFPPGTLFQSYYKYGAAPGDLTNHWYEFLDDGTTGAVIGIDRITLTLVDGERGDDDLIVNGTIVDPGAPALLSYGFTGFLEPVDNPPVLNQVKAGRVVPVKFELSGNFGLAILQDGYPRSQAFVCLTGMPIDTIEESTAVGNNELKFDAATGSYIYTWKTDKASAGTCRHFELKLNDGTAAHAADFKFIK